MGKQPSPPKKTSLGKGKVTPVQVAFIVHRYLADNHYSATLAAFRSDAALLFSKTKSKEPPKGLLGLADILDDYVTLKEQRLSVEREKERVEAVLRGINAAVESYRSSAGGGVRSPESPPLSALGLSPISPLTPANVPAIQSDVSPAGPITQVSSLSTIPPCLRPILPSNLPTSSKRKSTIQRSAPAKKLSEGSTSVTSRPQILQSTKQEINNQSKPSSSQDLLAQPPVSDCSPSSSNTFPSQQTPTKCSIVSSKTIVVSPFKGKGYITMEKSVCITSPMKSSPQNLSRRGRVKGRLDFDDTNLMTSSASQSIAETVSNVSDSGATELFDLDLSAFDMDFNFADLLGNIDLDSDDLGACHPPTSGLMLDTRTDFSPADIGDVGAVASVTTTTTCVNVINPVKPKR